MHKHAEDNPQLKQQMVSATFVTVCFFLLKSVLQAIAGWLGLTLFKKVMSKFSRSKDAVDSEVYKGES